MPKASPGITSFNAGELSPRLDGRVDIDKYAKGCRTLENFLPLVQGGAEKRSGTRYVRASTGVRRVIRFTFNTDDAYIISFASSGIIFHRDNAVVYSSTKTITGATQANPVVITSNAHGFTNGDIIMIAGVLGMTELNNNTFTVAGATANTFQLSGIDGTGFSAYTSGGTASEVYIVACPYSDAEIDQLQFRGQNDVLYIACPTKPPKKLSRFGDANWTLADVAFDYFPFSPENTDPDSYIVSLIPDPVGNSTILYSSDAIFEAGHVGSYIKLREIIESNNAKWGPQESFVGSYVPWADGAAGMAVGGHCYHEDKVYELLNKHSGGGTGKQPPVHDEGIGFDGRWEWEFYNYGFGYARIHTVTDAHRASATVVKPFPLSCVTSLEGISSTSAANPVVVTTATANIYETGDVIFIFGTTNSAINNAAYTITRLSSTTFSIPLNGGVVGASTVGSAVRMKSGPQVSNPEIRPTSGALWSWGAWDEVRGYPRAVCFFEDRLCWAGTSANPQTVWASVTGDYEDHRTFDADDSALVFTLAASDPIQWVLDANALVIGTSGEEFASNRNSAEPLSPSTVSTMRLRSRYGSREFVQPAGVENVILFAQRAGRKLRELGWDDAQDSFVAPDLTRLADHITGGLIRDLAFAGEPNRILWVVLETGELLAFTYERDDQVFGWHRHVVGGVNPLVKSVAVIPHPDGDGDQVWLIVERTVGGGQVRFVEYMEKQWLRTSDIEDAHFVDCGLSYSGAPATVFSGLRFLAGETVAVLADGVYVGTHVVNTAGRVTLAAAASTVHIGLPYSATLVPSRLEAGAGDGTAQGKVKRIHGVVLRLDQTGKGLYLGPSVAKATQEVRLTAGALHDGDTPLVAFPGGYDFDGLVAVRHTSPLPCTVTAIYPQLHSQDR